MDADEIKTAKTESLKKIVNALLFHLRPSASHLRPAVQLKRGG
jgi:hypothetical protein